MKWMNSPMRSLMFGWLIFLASARFAAAEDWPQGYVVHEDSESPDEQYGILVPDQDHEEGDNFFANLKTHQILGKIEGTDYFEHQNHSGLEVFWASDSSYCVVQNDARYGMETISVLEIKDSTFSQIEIGEHIQKLLDGAMTKQARGKMSGYVSPYFRLGLDRKIRVRALSENNPKQFEGVKTYYALFQGTYDLTAKKWTVSDTRSITAVQSGALDTGYQKPAFEYVTYSDDDDRAESLDQQMNSVYQAAKFILPPPRFAKVKQEQTEWLRKRDAATSVKARCELMEARIKALQDYLW